MPAPLSSGMGLLAGLGEGLKAGVESFRTTREIQDKRRRDEEQKQQNNRQLGLLAAKSGLEVDPMSGEFVKNADEKLKEQALLNPLKPDSAGSQFYRGLLGKYSKDIPVPEDLTEAEGSKAFDALIKANTAEEGRKFRQSLFGATNDAKKEKRITELAQKFQKDLEPDASRTGNFGQISNTLIQAQKLKRLATDANGSVANLPSAQQEELAIGMARMLGGGAGATTDSRINALVPKSIQGDSQKVASWLLNEPRGANQQAFTKYMLGTIDRESSLAKEQMRAIQLRRLGAHTELKKLSPDIYSQILNNYELGEEQAAPAAAGSAKPQGLLQGGAPRAPSPLNMNNPGIKAALDAGYTPEEIMEHLNAGK